MLLDTHVLLWVLTDDDLLGPATRERLRAATAVHASAASTWELAIKAALGKVEVPAQLLALVEQAGLVWLPITAAHTWAVRDLELPHRDPFDRLLLAQARTEGLALVTADRVLLASHIEVELVDARD